MHGALRQGRHARRARSRQEAACLRKAKTTLGLLLPPRPAGPGDVWAQSPVLPGPPHAHAGPTAAPPRRRTRQQAGSTACAPARGGARSPGPAGEPCAHVQPCAAGVIRPARPERFHMPLLPAAAATAAAPLPRARLLARSRRGLLTLAEPLTRKMPSVCRRVGSCSSQPVHFCTILRMRRSRALSGSAIVVPTSCYLVSTPT